VRERNIRWKRERSIILESTHKAYYFNFINLLLLGSRENRAGLGEWDEINTAHERNERSRNLDTLISLTILKDAAKSTLCSNKSAVKHVNIGLLGVIFLLGTKTNFKSTRLIISAVGARNEFTEFLESREPSFKIVFLSSSIVKSTRNDVDYMIRDARD